MFWFLVPSMGFEPMHRYGTSLWEKRNWPLCHDGVTRWRLRTPSLSLLPKLLIVGGQRGIRTPELLRDQIYSLAPLTTRPPTQLDFLRSACRPLLWKSQTVRATLNYHQPSLERTLVLDDPSVRLINLELQLPHEHIPSMVFRLTSPIHRVGWIFPRPPLSWHTA